MIIPTRNRAETLQKCLSSLAVQTLPAERFEVIVVDNGSTDQTAAVASAFSADIQLVYSRREEPGLHVGRHEGFRLARAELLVYADDDIQAEPAWLEAIDAAFQDPQIAMVGGNNYPAFETPPPSWLRKLWERPVYKGQALGSLSVLDFGDGRFEMDPRYVWGCNFSIRREILAHAGGFHPDSLPRELIRFRGDGETHVSNHLRALRLRALFDSRASVHHFVPRHRMTHIYFGERAYAQGISDSYSAIRRARGIPSVPTRVWQVARETISRLLHSIHARTKSSEVADVLRIAQRSYWDGYWFHMHETARDPALLRWVLKENYF